MQEQGITQKKLAEKMGIAEISLSRSLRGNPTVETLDKIASALGVEIHELFKCEEGIIRCPNCGKKFTMEV